MRPDLFVPLEPFGGYVAHLIERIEQIRAQYFLAIRPIEALDVGILIGFAGLDEAWSG